MTVLTSCRGCGAPIPQTAVACPRCGLTTGTPQPHSAHSPAFTASAGGSAPQSGAAAPGASTPSSGMKALAMAAVAALLMGMVTGYMRARPQGPPKGRIVAQMPVGPKGGTVPFDGGGEVRIPEGALAETEEIVVYRTVIEEEVSVPQPSGPPVVFAPGTLGVYYFGPFGLVFGAPVTIVIPLPPGLAGQVFVFSGGQIQIVNAQVQGNAVVVVVRGFGPGLIGVV